MATKEDFTKLKLGLQLDTRGAFAQALRDVINLNQVAQLALDHLSYLFRGADLTLALATSKENHLEPVWTNNKGETCSQFLEKEGTLWDVALKTFKGQDRRLPLDVYAAEVNIEGHLLGVLVLRGGDEETRSIIDFVARELGQTATQMDEISEVQQLSRELAILNQIGKSLTAYLELDNILVATMQGIWELFQVEVASLFLLDLMRRVFSSKSHSLGNRIRSNDSMREK